MIRMLEKLLFSLARPESAKTAFSLRDASFLMRRSRIAQKLNVPKRTPRLFARCGLAERPFEHPTGHSNGSWNLYVCHPVRSDS